MAKTTTEKIEGVQEEIRQLKNREKQLVQQQKEQARKDRTHRLIQRGALVESLIDGAELLTNEQIKVVLSAALNTEPAIEILISMQEKRNAAESVDLKMAQGVRL